MKKVVHFIKQYGDSLLAAVILSILSAVLIWKAYINEGFIQEAKEAAAILLAVSMTILIPAGLVITVILKTRDKRRKPFRWIVSFGLAFVGLTLLFFAFIVVLFPLIYKDPTPEEYAAKVSSHENYFREMWSDCSYLDKITGIDFPDYTVDSVKCDYVTFPPTDYEYNVELALVFSKPVPRSIYSDIREAMKVDTLAVNSAEGPEGPRREWKSSGGGWWTGYVLEQGEYICEYVPWHYGDWPGDEGTTLVLNAHRDTIFVTEWHY